MNVVVAKFGGTSMGNAQAITRVAEILKGQGEPVVAVVSAVAGVTDQLLKLGQMALRNEDWQGEFGSFCSRHQEIIKNLAVDLDTAPFYSELEKLLRGISLVGEISLSKADHLMSFGERISSLMLYQKLKALGLRAERIDTKELIMTDNHYTEANVNFQKTNTLIEERVKPLLEDGRLVVLTGFIGQSADGNYSTLGRGGSDFTGAIAAAALGARELQIWTDVDGIYSSDPKLIREAKVVPRLSFGEAGELAYFGAKVLHPKTVLPTIKKNIPVRILNTFNPEAAGTLITPEGDKPGLKAVAWKRGATIINVYSTRMLAAHGFLARIFSVFALHEIAVDVLTTSEISVSLTVDVKLPAELIRELSEFSEVSIVPDQAIICLVGEGLADIKGILGNLFLCLQDHRIRMVSQGASERNITFLVHQDEAETVVKKVFYKFLIQS